MNRAHGPGIALLATLSLTAFAAAQQGEPFAFDEVTAAAGLSGYGPTFGPGAWGDVNGDGLPDLWVGNHAGPPQLFVQQPGGLFVDQASLWLSGTLTRDTHGVAWADADGDGDQDLAELVGSGNSVTGQNRLWQNEGGSLIDIYLPRDLQLARELGMADFGSVQAAHDVIMGCTVRTIQSVILGKAPADHFRSTLEIAFKGIGIDPARAREVCRMPLPALPLSGDSDFTKLIRGE